MNKHAYRVIFSQVSRTFIAVAELIFSQGKNKSTSTNVSSANDICNKFFSATHQHKSTIGLSIIIAGLFNPLITHAQMVAYKNGTGSRPTIDQSANGRTLIQIVTPNSSGLSHNRYDQFNVDNHGAIFNNSTAMTQTELAGYINGNPNLVSGKNAKVILNEVMSTNRSQLNGYMEVAGQRAEVIVANPNGISVGNGTGFINASRGVLTTGTPILGSDGALTAFRVSKGDITIGAGGMNGTGAEQLDLIARSVQVNDALWANKLNVISGSNQVDYAALGVQVIAGEGGQPIVGIDSSSLGGMYAQKIWLVGTEAGVGVKTLGAISASTGDITIDSRGKVSLNGQTNAAGKIQLRSDDDISNSGTLYGQQTVSINSAGMLTNTGTLAAMHDLEVQANSIDSSGVFAAGINSTGQVSESGNLTLTAAKRLSATGQNIAGGNFTLLGSDINLANANTSANGQATLTATSGDINHAGGTLTVAGYSVITAAGNIINDAGAIRTTQLTIRSGAVSNKAGSIIQSGSGATNLVTVGLLDNSNGTILSNGQDWQLQTGGLINDSGNLSHAGNGVFTISGGMLDNKAGTIISNGELHLGATDFNNLSGQLIANRAASLKVHGDVNNAQGSIQSAAALTIDADNIDNTAGRIISLNSDGLTLSADGLITNVIGATVQGEAGGVIGGNGNVLLSADAIVNSSTITAAQKLTGTVEHRLTNSGRMAAGNQLQLSAEELMNAHGVLDASSVSVNVNELNNNFGSISADQLQLHASNFFNQHGQLKQYGASASVIDVAHVLDNSDNGLIQTNSVDLTLTPEQLINNGGTISHAGTGVFTINLNHGQGVLQNERGVIGSNGNVIATAAEINNRTGKLFGQGALMLTATNGNFNNRDQGYVSGDQLTIHVSGDVNNTAGKIESVKNGLLMTANNFINSGGTLQNLGASTLDVQLRKHLMNVKSHNVGGFIGSAGNINVKAAQIDNSYGTFYAKNDMLLTSDGALTNLAGVIQSDGTMGIDARNQIHNQYGRIEANGNGNSNGDSITPSLMIRGSNINNMSGRIANSGTGSTYIHSDKAITNDGGTMGGNGDVILDADTFNNAQKGQVIAAGNLGLQIASNLDNTQGSLYAAKNLTMQQNSASFNNTLGSISASGNIKLAVANLDNTGGQIGSAVPVSNTVDENSEEESGNIELIAGSHIINTNGNIGSAKNLSMQMQNMVGSGHIVAGQDAAIHMQGDYTVTKDNAIHANRDLTLTTSGTLHNQANLEAVRNLTLTAGNITNDYGALINAGSGTAFLNALNAFYNMGRIYGDDVAISALNFTNDGVLNADGSTNRAGVIAARNNLDIAAAIITNREHALLQSLGNMAIGRGLDDQHHAAGKAEYVLNSSATIDAGANLNLQTAKLDNINAHFATALVTDPSLTIDNAVEYQEEGSSVIYRKDQVRFGTDNKGGRVMILPDGRKVERFFERVYKQTTRKTVIIQSDPALIQSGGNLILSGGVFNNYQSAILAGATLAGDLTNLVNSDVKGIILTGRAGTQKYYYLESCGWFGGDHCNRDDGGKSYAVSLPSASISLNIWQVKSDTNLTHQPDTAVGVDAGKVPTAGAGALGSNQDGQQLSGSGQRVDDITGFAGGNADVNGETQTVSSGATPIPNLTLPNSQLFPVTTNPAAGYVIETDPKFTNYKNFLSSDYLLSRLLLNPQLAQKRLGDGFYEQKLINDQIVQLTGKRFLGDYTSNEQQYQALMESGIKFAEQFQLTPGIGLTASQMAALTSDMVWLVSQEITMPDGAKNNVLVPVVYLAKVDASHVLPGGAIISGRNIDLAVKGTLENGGTMQGTNNTLIHATDIINTGTLRSDAAQGATVLVADNDVINHGGTISGNRVGILAGRDVNLITDTVTAKSNNGTNIGLDRIAAVSAGQLSIQSGRDVTLAAASVTTTGDASIVAGRDLNLTSVTTQNQLNIANDGQNHLNQSQTFVNGTQFQSAGNITLSAGQDLNASAAYVNADKALTAVAGRDANISSAQQQSQYDMEVYTAKSGALSSSTRYVHDNQQSTQSIGSTFSGDSVQLVAGNNINITGSNIVGTNNVGVVAGNNIHVAASQDTSSRHYSREETHSGLFTGGLSVTFGDKAEENTTVRHQLTNNASIIGSTNGNVAIVAGNNYTQTGSNVVALSGDINIAARSVDIVAVHDSYDQTNTNHMEQSGLSLGVSAPVITALQTVQQMNSAMHQTDDKRMKLLAGATAAAAASNAATAAQSPTAGVTASLTVGSSESDSQSTQTSQMVVGSKITAGGNVVISATGAGENSNLNIVGSDVTAGHGALLKADGNINLLTAQNTSIQQSSSSSSSAAVGVAATYGSNGGALGFTASAAGSRGDADGSDVAYTNSHITAGKALIIESGHDTNLIGAVASADQILANVGTSGSGNLTIQSLQDTSKYHSEDQSIGGSVTIGYGYSGSLNANQSHANGEFANVGEQSGIKSGNGGFIINVNGNTDLAGGLISSTAPLTNNALMTQTLTQRDIKNYANADADSSGIGLSTDMATQGKYGIAKAIATNFLNGSEGSGFSEGATRSAISAGTVIISNDQKQQELTGTTAGTTIANLNRDTENSHTAAKQQDVQAIVKEVNANQAIKQAVVTEATKFTDETYRTAFIKKADIYVVEKDGEGNPVARKLTETEKQNLQAGKDGKVHIADNGIFNDIDSAAKYADQHATASDGPQYLIHYPEADNALSELMVAGYQKFLENDTLGLSNATQETKDLLNQYGQTGLHLDGHSRGAMTIGNALESIQNQADASGSLAKTNINFFGPAYNAQQADKILAGLQNRDGITNIDDKNKSVLNYMNHTADPVGKWIGGNPDTGGTIPEGGSFVGEVLRVLGGENTAHNCYGHSESKACQPFWHGSPSSQPVLQPIKKY